MNKDNNLPCPFCGGPAAVVFSEHVITCGGPDDDCLGKTIRAECDGVNTETFDYTSTPWNTRARPEDLRSNEQRRPNWSDK